MTVTVVGSTVTMAVTMSSVGIMTVPVTMTVAVIGGRNGNLEVVPCHVCEDTILDVASQVALL